MPNLDTRNSLNILKSFLTHSWWTHSWCNNSTQWWWGANKANSEEWEEEPHSNKAWWECHKWCNNNSETDNPDHKQDNSCKIKINKDSTPNNQEITYKLNTEENNKIKLNTIKIKTKTKSIMEFNNNLQDQPITGRLDKTQHNNNKLELLLLNSPHKIWKKIYLLSSNLNKMKKDQY